MQAEPVLESTPEFVSPPTNPLDALGLKYISDPETVKGKQYQGGDKTSLHHHFTETYHRLFQGLCSQPINLLELGVLNGRSLAMWSDYFPKGQIYGLDCYLKRFEKSQPELEALGAFRNKNVHVYEADVTDRPVFGELIAQWPNFQIIIDDALHQAKAQWQNFLLLFPKLNLGGLYIIEDIEKPSTFLTVFSDLMAGVTAPKSKFAVQHKLAPIIQQIESIELRAGQVIILKKSN